MQNMHKYDLKPRITVGEEDHRRLIALTAAGGHLSEAADDLLEEIERARVVPQDKLPGDIVRMGSAVTYRPDNGVERTVTLVYPAEADIAQNRISVLTPVGTALIGLARGQSITWTARNGTRHVLSVIAVTDPVDA